MGGGMWVARREVRDLSLRIHLSRHLKQGSEHRATWGSIPGRGHSLYKGPAAEACQRHYLLVEQLRSQCATARLIKERISPWELVKNLGLWLLFDLAQVS